MKNACIHSLNVGGCLLVLSGIYFESAVMIILGAGMTIVFLGLLLVKVKHQSKKDEDPTQGDK